MDARWAWRLATGEPDGPPANLADATAGALTATTTVATMTMRLMSFNMMFSLGLLVCVWA
jgi:hypothetical protein